MPHIKTKPSQYKSISHQLTNKRVETKEKQKRLTHYAQLPHGIHVTPQKKKKCQCTEVGGGVMETKAAGQIVGFNSKHSIKRLLSCMLKLHWEQRSEVSVAFLF